MAGDGEEGIRTAEREKPDLVLMDMHMPVMNGVTATRAIRRSGAEVSLPGRRTIISMSANVLAESVEECREAGMDDFMPKPFTRAEMAELQRALLEVRAQRAVVLDGRVREDVQVLELELVLVFEHND